MSKVIFILISFLYILGCSRSGKQIPNELENSDSFNIELNTLKNAKKSELFKIVEVGKLKRDLMRQSSKLEKEVYAKKKEELLIFIEKAPRLHMGFVLEGTAVSLTKSQIKKFKVLQKQNLKENIENPLMGNIGCGFNADYCLRFYYGEDRVDYIFCFSCNQYKIYINEVYQKNIYFFIYIEKSLKDLIQQITLNK